MSQNIWLTNDGGHRDYSRALSFAPAGEIKPLTVGSVNIFQTDRLVQQLTLGITRYTRSDDFLILSGSSLICSLALHVWLRMHGRCNLLIYHARESIYILRDIDNDHINESIDREIMRGSPSL